jgi:hypothetical protein
MCEINHFKIYVLYKEDDLIDALQVEKWFMVTYAREREDGHSFFVI